tara:strand:+ start:301 stop:543 length:243 start_codon:yes stop_codon:yes gene_type:complete
METPLALVEDLIALEMLKDLDGLGGLKIGVGLLGFEWELKGRAFHMVDEHEQVSWIDSGVLWGAAKEVIWMGHEELVQSA